MNDYIGDEHTYVMMDRVVESVTKRGIIGTYEYIDENGRKTISGTAVYGVEEGAAFIEYNANSVSNIENLPIGVTLDSVGQLTALSQGITYNVWDKVLVLEHKDADYRVMTLLDIENNDNYSLVGWMDKTPDRGGMIRIIIATPQKK